MFYVEVGVLELFYFLPLDGKIMTWQFYIRKVDPSMLFYSRGSKSFLYWAHVRTNEVSDNIATEYRNWKSDSVARPCD